MTDAEFQALYERALTYQANGDFESYSNMLQTAYEAGAPQEALTMLGALSESVLAASLLHGPA